MPEDLAKLFIELDLLSSLQIIILGLIGGTLSGFIGSGGAFFMTPGMMNLGVHGPIAVGSNITHKFGKALMGSKKHGEMGHVDKKLAIFLVLTAFAGIWAAATIMTMLFTSYSKNLPEEAKGAMSDLYISVIFIVFLSLVAISILRDALKNGNKDDIEQGPSRKLVDFFARLRIQPVIYFPVADVGISLWVLLLIGFITGYMAGTIGVGGFIGVPAMIYIFGVPTQVATGTELFLAMFMGAFGAINYAWQGFVDIRLTMLMYLGSLIGIYIGSYGTKVVKEVVIRIVTGTIILLCVLSRLIAVPVYLRQLQWIHLDIRYDYYFNNASKILLFVAGITGTLIIFYNVFKAYRQRNRIRETLTIKASDISST